MKNLIGLIKTMSTDFNLWLESKHTDVWNLSVRCSTTNETLHRSSSDLEVLLHDVLKELAVRSNQDYNVLLGLRYVNALERAEEVLHNRVIECISAEAFLHDIPGAVHVAVIGRNHSGRSMLLDAIDAALTDGGIDVIRADYLQESNANPGRAGSLALRELGTLTRVVTYQVGIPGYHTRPIS